MKKTTLTTILAGLTAMGMSAHEASEFTIFINPGHGGHDADDRNVVISPYTQGDPEGYWESNSNLTKGLALRELLQEKGYKVLMSRTTNTTADDLGLSTISQLANEANSDLFFSIHSNATGTSARRNFPLMLFRGYDDEPVKPEDKVVCGILNKYLLQNQATYWTSTNTNVRGDWSFYTSWGTQGLGVLRRLTVTGMLSEGSFHDYIPETYRLMNADFCWLEAWQFRRAIDEYLDVPGVDYGAVAGRLNDNRVPRDGDFKMFGDDLFASILGAKVELINDKGEVVETYTTETKHPNGIFIFKHVAPGHYTLKATVETHYEVSSEIDVVANEVTYKNMTMSKVRSTPPVVESYSPVWNTDDEGVLCNTPIVIQFNWDMDTEATEKAFTITPAVNGTFSWEDLNYRMVFTPSDPYNTDTEYTVSLSTDAKHAGGMSLETPLQFKFKTNDRNFMEILGHFPKQDDAVHFHNASIEFRFDRHPNITPILNQVTCTDSKGNAVSFNKRSMTYSKTSSAYGFFRIPFTNDLTVGETYNLKISGDFADKDGLTIQEPVDLTFTAVDAASQSSGEGTLVDDTTVASDYVYNENSSLNVTSASTASYSNKLFDGAISFKYEFPETEGSEVLWSRENQHNSEAIINNGDVIGIHVNGDLTANKLYLELAGEASTLYQYVCDLDFLGWKYIQVHAVIESASRLTGVKLVQNPSQMSASGSFAIDKITVNNSSDGVNDLEISALTVHPNPASEYLVANADVVIESIELVGTNGVTVAKSAGNVLNVSEVMSGNYIAVISTANSRASRRVVIKH